MALDMETISEMVEKTMANYDHPEMKTMPEKRHFENVAPCYGFIAPLQPVEEQMADTGKIIAVLYWKLAQARGYVPTEENE